MRPVLLSQARLAIKPAAQSVLRIRTSISVYAAPHIYEFKSCRALASLPRGHPHDAVSQLSTEVLRFRLEALNLPISGSCPQLIRALRAAMSGAETPSSGHPHATASGRVRKRRRSARSHASRSSPAVLPHQDVPPPVPEDETGSLSDAASSLGDIGDQLGRVDAGVFTPAQLAAIQQTVTESVQVFMTSLASTPRRPREAAQPPRQSRVGSASRLGLTRPLDRTLEERILRGEYIDFACLLPDSLAQPQTPDLQWRLDQSPSSSGSPLSMVRRKKPVVDTFQKWLDVYTTYCWCS